MSDGKTFGFGGVWRWLVRARAAVLLLAFASTAAHAASSTTTLITGSSSAVYGERVSLTARVASVGRGSATGTVTFKEGTRSIGSIGLGASAAGQSLTSGDFHNCILTPTRTVGCWGLNIYGELGDGTDKSRVSSPAAVKNLSGVSAISAGAHHTCALTGAGTVSCWGANDLGQIGDGTTVDRWAPVGVKGPKGVAAIAAGGSHSCAALHSGEVVCWGNNNYGQLGDGTRKNHTVPVAVPGLSGVIAVSAGWSHTCALIRTGAVKCWGANYSGQLGDDSFEDQTRPVAVLGLSGVVAISNGSEHSCAVLATGLVKCWGSSTEGQLGIGTNVIRGRPVLVPALSGAVSIATGVRHTVAATKTEELKFWGTMRYDGAYSEKIFSASPATFSWTSSGAIGAGRSNFCLVSVNNGRLACVGYDSYGRRLDDDLYIFYALAQSGATLRTSVLGVGKHVVTAVYGGDTYHSGSTTAVGQTIIVTKGSTQTAATASATTIPAGRSLTLAAAVAAKAPAAGTASGKVRILDGTRLLATVSLVGGKASFATSTLAVGSHTLTMVYDGDANFLASTSPGVTVTVTKASTSMASE